MAKVNPIQAQKFLKGVDYPVKKDALIEHAQKMGADENVLEALKALPDQTFDAPVAVSKALGAEE